MSDNNLSSTSAILVPCGAAARMRPPLCCSPCTAPAYLFSFQLAPSTGRTHFVIGDIPRFSAPCSLADSAAAPGLRNLSFHPRRSSGSETGVVYCRGVPSREEYGGIGRRIPQRAVSMGSSTYGVSVVGQMGQVGLCLQSLRLRLQFGPVVQVRVLFES
ncbi:hypothetical protein DFH06DRAFT_115472 [Mycena polygramma]|nr:hypothetical protein DFH06DRAFT_115472 [Mycena polygramma]